MSLRLKSDRRTSLLATDRTHILAIADTTPSVNVAHWWCRRSAVQPHEVQPPVCHHLCIQLVRSSHVDYNRLGPCERIVRKHRDLLAAIHHEPRKARTTNSDRNRPVTMHYDM